MKHAMSFNKRTGDPSAERTKLIYELLAERATGFNVRHVVTNPMRDGLEFEDEMFDKFVEATGRTVRLSRLYDHPTIENFQASPDREIDDGLMEGKVPVVETFIRWKLAGIVPEEHKAQMIAQCLCSGKEWVAFVSYCPWIKDPRKQLFVKKYVPTAEERAHVLGAAIAFLEELDAMWAEFIITPVAAVGGVATHAPRKLRMSDD